MSSVQDRDALNASDTAMVLLFFANLIAPHFSNSFIWPLLSATIKISGPLIVLRINDADKRTKEAARRGAIQEKK